MKNLILNFDEMGGKKDASIKAIAKAFEKAGAKLAQGEVTQGVRRTSGVTYREMLLTFVDSQTVTLMVKQSGDIYQVKLNGRVMPISNQDDHQAAAAEITAKMEAGRTTFQKRLASINAELPKTIRTAVPKMEAVLAQKNIQLDEAIAEVKQEILKVDEELK